eukprot:1161022-Pelagomonas_calceolata.AAC.9
MLASKLSSHATQSLITTIDNRRALKLQKGFGGGICWVHSGGEREKESPGIQEYGLQPSRSPFALLLAFFKDSYI